MEIAEILSPDRCAVEAGITSKKAVLERLAELISATDKRLTTTMVFDSLIARERLGSTGLGMGVAIPHGRNNIQEAAVGACLLTREDVEFDSIDGQPVRIFFALSVPDEATQEHLQILAKIAECFSDRALVDKIRAADSADVVYRLLTGN